MEELYHGQRVAVADEVHERRLCDDLRIDAVYEWHVIDDEFS